MTCFVNLKGCNVGFKLVILSGDELSHISSNKLIKKISIKQKIQKEISRTTLLQQLSKQSIGLSSSSFRVWKRGSTKSGPMAADSQPTSGNFFLFFYFILFFYTALVLPTTLSSLFLLNFFFSSILLYWTLCLQ